MRQKGFAQVIILILIIVGLGIVGYFSYKNRLSALKSESSPPNLTSSPVFEPETSNNNQKVNDLCNFSIKLPEGYQFGDASNSPFYGLSVKDKNGQMCKVIYGPHFRPGWEGFAGENIQINVYSSNLVTMEMIENSCCSPVLKNKTAISYRYERSGFGGTDQVFLKKINNKIYEIIWRNDPSDIWVVVNNLSYQLK